MEKRGEKRPAESEAERRQRQAEALRENLRRRKEQARAREAGVPPDADRDVPEKPC